MEPSRQPLRRALWVLTLVHAALFATALVPASVVEAVHARALFPALRALLATPTAALPFSLAELGIVVLGLALPLGLVLALWGPAPAERGGRRGSLRRFGGRVAVTAAVLANLYLLGFGWLYQRPPLLDRLGLELREDPEHFAAVALALADRTRLARTALPEAPDLDAVSLQARLDLARVLPGLDGPGSLPPTRLKPCLPAGLLQTSGISGVFSPFTQECHLDPALDPLDLPFTACHELSHLAGLGPEDEANFVGFVAGLRSTDPWFRYSALVHCLARFEHQASDDLVARLRERAGPEVLADRRRAASRSSRYRNVTITKITWKVYDGVLQAQGVEAGVRSYDRMTRLVLAWWPGHDR